MDLKRIKRTITIVVYGLVSIVVALIVVRLLLLVIGANKSSAVVAFVYGASDVFVGVFRGIYPNIVINEGQFVIEIYSIIGLSFYLSLAFLISKSIKSVFETDPIQIITNLIDTGFKFAEFILITRFVFKLTGASVASQFVAVLYDISGIIYEPFKGILPGFSIPSLNAVFETSTIIAIVIIIIFDVASESIIAHLRKEAEEANMRKADKAPAPNITINIPQQAPVHQPPTQYIDSRTVHVVSPNIPLQPHQPNYPYFDANNLEKQRPKRAQQLSGQGYYTQPNNEPMAPRNASPSSVNS
jgi:hypothetical protein